MMDNTSNYDRFREVMTPATPRLVVMYRKDGTNEAFQWGMVGAIPLMSLLGGIIRVQAELAFRAAEPCPESALCIVWHDSSRSFEWFVHESIPVDALVGMLETIKATILGSHMARQAAAQQVILGPDGQPIQR